MVLKNVSHKVKKRNFEAFTKLRKTTISFVTSVRSYFRLSVRKEQLGSHLTDFHEIWYLSTFR